MVRISDSVTSTLTCAKHLKRYSNLLKAQEPELLIALILKGGGGAERQRAGLPNFCVRGIPSRKAVLVGGLVSVSAWSSHLPVL